MGVWSSVGLTLTWRSGVDQPEQNATNYVIRMRASDASGNGPDSQTMPFAVDNSSTPTTGTSNDNSAIGINLSACDYYSTQYPWADLMKQCSEWFTTDESQAWDTGVMAEIPVDAEGYPLQLPYVVPSRPTFHTFVQTLFRNGGAFPNGEYVVLYDGEGTLGFGFDATVTSSAPGRITINVTSTNNGFRMWIQTSNVDNHVRNIRVIMPGLESTYATDPVHPRFRELMSPFKVFRFVDMAKTINSQNQEWANRAKYPWYTYTTSAGAPVEAMVALANACHVDAWFNMPVMATDEYIHNFAAYVAANLQPGLKVYIEYANEVWNPGFVEYHYAAQQGAILHPEYSEPARAIFWYSKRAVEMFTIWETAFGGTNRLVRLLAWQAAGSYNGGLMLDTNNAYQHADAYAIAPYFGLVALPDALLNDPASEQNESVVQNMTVEQVLDWDENDINTRISEWITTAKAMADARGLQLISYEGGQHNVGVGTAIHNEALSALFIAVNRDPRMQHLYDIYLNKWKELGGHTFMAYKSLIAYTGWGSWGFMEHQYQDPNTAPKYQGLKTFAIDHPKWW
jgi:hypothetical protein